MSQRVIGIAVFTVALASFALPGTAPANNNNRTATRAYLVDEYVFAKEAAKALPTAGLTSLERFAAAIGAECPDALKGAPAVQERSAVALELIVSELRALAAPLRPAVDRLATLTTHVRWDDRVLTRLVHTNLVRGVRVLFGPSLAICPDIRSWVASGYTQLPAGAQSVKRLIDSSETETQISERLVRYESPALRRLVRRTEAINRATDRTYLPRYNAIIANTNKALGIPEKPGSEVGQLKTPSR